MEALNKGLETIKKNLDRQVSKGTITEEQKGETIQRISTFTDYKKAFEEVDLVVEAATENVDLKLKIFKEIDGYCGAKTILASNTSSISITKIASVTSRPDKVIGMHFMNPVPVMKLVEVINGFDTSKEVTASIMEL